jgi:hypothetical protein
MYRLTTGNPKSGHLGANSKRMLEDEYRISIEFLVLKLHPKTKDKKHAEKTKKHGRASIIIGPANLSKYLKVICGCLAPPPRFISN